MCGRAYQTYTDAELACLHDNGKSPKLDWLTPNYNLAPTETSPVVLVRDDMRVFEPFRWGLVPSWAKSIQATSKYALINARGEEITEKRTYAEPFQRRRCVVPLSGFYEWKRQGSSKRPFAIHLQDRQVMAVAGVWERWQAAGEMVPVHSFAIVTTVANDFMSNIHDRMPVILGDQEIDQWLDPEVQEFEQLIPLVRPCVSEWLSAYEVSTLVNSPQHKSPDVVHPREA